MARSTMVLLVSGALFAAVVAVAAVIASRAGDEAKFADGTPERTVQIYLDAVEARDATAAFAYISDTLVERCGEPPRQQITQRGDSSFRATLDRSDVRGSTAVVDIELSERWGDGPFDLDDTKQALSFELELNEGVWEFAELPWPLYACASKPVTAQ